MGNVEYCGYWFWCIILTFHSPCSQLRRADSWLASGGAGCVHSAHRRVCAGWHPCTRPTRFLRSTFGEYTLLTLIFTLLQYKNIQISKPLTPYLNYRICRAFLKNLHILILKKKSRFMRGVADVSQGQLILKNRVRSIRISWNPA